MGYYHGSHRLTDRQTFAIYVSHRLGMNSTLQGEHR